MSEPFRINRVVLKNYRSIAACDVELKNLTFLSGPNGSGKSNFMDALRFVADSLQTTLERAISDRGGIREIICRSGTPAEVVSIGICFTIGTSVEGQYSFDVRSATQGSFYVLREHCSITDLGTGEKNHYTIAQNQPFQSSPGVPPPIAQDRLHLVHASSAKSFRPLYSALANMGFYNLEPKSMIQPRPASLELDDALLPSGANVTLVLDQLCQRHPRVKDRIEAYLKGIVPNLVSIVVEGDLYRYLRFKFEFAASELPLVFGAQNMSEGTLRALGVLAALFQRPENGSGRSLSLVGIEEPEVALHPAAARLLFEALGEASESRQVIVATHSPDLLDSNDVENDSILAVQIGDDGATIIGPVDDAGRTMLLKRLYTPGELMRINQLQPGRSVADSMTMTDEVQTGLSPDQQ